MNDKTAFLPRNDGSGLFENEYFQTKNAIRDMVNNFFAYFDYFSRIFKFGTINMPQWDNDMQTIILAQDSQAIYLFLILIFCGACAQLCGLIAHKKFIFLTGSVCVMAAALLERDPVLFIGQLLGSIGYIYLSK